MKSPKKNYSFMSPKNSKVIFNASLLLDLATIIYKEAPLRQKKKKKGIKVAFCPLTIIT